jgi:hypothetical protein
MGPGTIEALQAIITELAHDPDALVVSATDANVAGDRYAECHAEFADAARVRFERLRPPDNRDWNDVLKKARGDETCLWFGSVAVTAAGKPA